MAVETMDPAQEYEAKLIARMEPVNEVMARGTSAVQQFYSCATVFLTGGSGFLGKQLIEKLFRATKVSKIFILLRSKKGKSVQQRLTEMLQDPVYDLLREQQPDFAEKLVPVSGDVAELRLGLSDKDWNAITEQVDIVFHLAATTRFDEPLRVATFINIRGTRETLMLGKGCKNLRSFVYVSTAYSHTCVDRINSAVSEKFYKSPINPNVMIGIAETVDEGRINDITPSLTNNWPNTYTFTKSIAEELVTTLGKELPICVVRPAIVVPSKQEPNPGWLDMSCMYGMSGMFTACGLGVMHVVNVDSSTHLTIVPVDYVNNVVIAAGCETASKRATGENETKIYAVTSLPRNPISYGGFHEILVQHVMNYTTPMIVGYGFAWCSKNHILFWMYSWLLHLIPAHILDGISVMLGNNRRFVKLANKMYNLSKSVSYFACNDWQFDDQNTTALFNSLSKDDRDIFNFDINAIDWKEYMLTWCIGIRKYILKDGLKDTLYARKKNKVFKVLTYIILPLYFYCLYRILCLVLSVFTLLWQIIH